MDVTASVLTLSGSEYGQPVRYGALERAKAAHAAGISSIGVSLDEELAPAILKYVSVPECEWVNLNERPTFQLMSRISKISEQYGVIRINCGVCDPQGDAQQAILTLAVLCASFPELTFAVEPVAFGSHPAIRNIRRLLSGALNPRNAGVLLDVWQVSDSFDLPMSPPEYPVAEIQLCGRFSAGNYPSGTPVRDAAMDRATLAEDSGTGMDFRSWLKRVNVANAPLSYEMPRRQWREEFTCLQMAQAMAADLEEIT